MNAVTEDKRTKKPKTGRQRCADLASSLNEELDALDMAEQQSVNATLNGNHEITVADAKRMLGALSTVLGDAR